MHPESLGHCANVLFGVAYLVRGIFWLRMLSIIACAMMAVFNYHAPVQPLWVAIYWNVLFAAVNAAQVWLLLRERTAVSLSDEEDTLYRTRFRHMSLMEFARIVRTGRWQTVAAGTPLLEKDCVVSKIRLVHRGSVCVETDGDTRLNLSDGAFVGEIAFVSGARASGRVATLTESRVLSWAFDDLRRLFHRHPELRSGFLTSVSCDLASKLVSTKSNAPACPRSLAQPVRHRRSHGKSSSWLPILLMINALRNRSGR